MDDTAKINKIHHLTGVLDSQMDRALERIAGMADADASSVLAGSPHVWRDTLNAIRDLAKDGCELSAIADCFGTAPKKEERNQTKTGTSDRQEKSGFNRGE